jgi:regulator of sigma E protease
MTVAAAVLAVIGFVILIIAHEGGHFAAAKAVGMRVERFALFFPPLIWRKKRGETEYAIGALPLGGYVKITGMNPSEDLPDEVRTRAYTAQPVWKRITVIAAGPAVNLVLAFILIVAFFWLIGPREVTSNVGQIEKEYPAQGQLQPGDKIVAVDGKRGDNRDFAQQINRHKCPGGRQVDRCRAAEPVTLTIVRDGRQQTLSLTPIHDEQAKRMRLGFAYAEGDRQPEDFGAAVSTGADRFWFVTKETVKLPARILDAEDRKEISGVVGSYEVTRRTILDDVADVVGIMALISLSLAIVNLFPFLPLDGGHIFWSLVEAIRRRPVSYATMERASVVGFMLVLGLFVIGFTNDLDRLQNGGFDVR